MNTEPTLKTFLIQMQSQINALTYFDDDIFLTSYPRSGNGWMRFLLGSLLKHRRIDFHNLEELVPGIYGRSNAFLCTLSRPRIIKTHEKYNQRFKKVIYLVRDPRDVVVSYYHYYVYTFKDSYHEDFNAFFNRFVTGNFLLPAHIAFGTWETNVSSWLEHAENAQQEFLLVRFEDIKQNTFGEIQKILSFLEMAREQQQIEAAIEWASFDNMQRLRKEHRPDIYTSEMRGVSGRGKQQLSQSQYDYLTTNYKSLLLKLGYET